MTKPPKTKARRTNPIHMAASLAAIAIIAAATPPTARAADHPPLRLAPVIIHDPQINNVEALRFLAPVGWKVKGGIVWNHNTWLLATLSVRISDPNSKASISLHPADTFTWSAGAAQVAAFNQGGRYMGSIVMQLPDDVRDTITKVIVPGVHPQLANAQVTAAESLPALAKVILDQNQEAGLEKDCQAARMRFSYDDPDGTPMEEDIYAVVIRTPVPSIGMTSWHLERCYSIRAEKGRLDALTPVLTTLLSSAKFGEDWVAGYNYVVQLRNAGNMQAIADAGAISRHIAENAEDMRRMNRESYENAQHTQDSASTAFSQTTRGVEDYNVPTESANTRVELPTGYNHAWYDASAGEYLLSDDPNFDPNTISNHTWTTIERTGR